MNSDLPRKHIVVVAAVIAAGREVLCVQRPPHTRDYISSKWEFPGGKVEPGESYAAALVREIHEELVLPVAVHDPITTVTHAYPDFDLTMHVFACTTAAPEVLELREHQSHVWLRPDDAAFAALDWAAADLPVVERLKVQAPVGR